MYMCVYEMEGRFHWEISLLAGEGGGALAAQFLVAIEGAFFFFFVNFKDQSAVRRVKGNT